MGAKSGLTEMSIPLLPPEPNQQALAHDVESLQHLVREQQQMIQAQQQTIEKLEALLLGQQGRLQQLAAELRDLKKLKGKPKLSASQLNEREAPEPEEGKRAGSAKRSKKAGFEVDEETIIEPEAIPENAKFNGYRTYDVQEIEIQRQNTFDFV